MMRTEAEIKREMKRKSEWYFRTLTASERVEWAKWYNAYIEALNWVLRAAE